MTEGYLILGPDDNVDRVELLAKSIKNIDSTRPITFITYEYIKSINGVDDIIRIDPITLPNKNLQYFYRVMNSPYDKTIAFTENQLLLSFDINVWETLSGLGPIVFPDCRLSYSYEKISNDTYWTSKVENDSFGVTPVLNIGYFNKTLGSDDIMGLCMDIAGKYNPTDYIVWLAEYKLNNDITLPNFPDHLWPEWIVAFMSLVTEDKINFYNFIDCVDLKKQDNNKYNDRWCHQSWNKFLNYWVTDNQIKIENFIQTGLLHYDDCNWLNIDSANKIKNGFK